MERERNPGGRCRKSIPRISLRYIRATAWFSFQRVASPFPRMSTCRRSGTGDVTPQSSVTRDKDEYLVTPLLRCHPSAGALRRGTAGTSVQKQARVARMERERNPGGRCRKAIPRISLRYIRATGLNSGFGVLPWAHDSSFSPVSSLAGEGCVPKQEATAQYTKVVV